MYGYNAEPPIAIPIYTVLPYCVILTSDLNDRQDIIRVIKDMNRKANSILCTFSSADPFVKCYLDVTVYPCMAALCGLFQLRL